MPRPNPLPNQYDCPNCGSTFKIKKNKHDVYKCTNCGGAWVADPDNIFGVT